MNESRPRTDGALKSAACDDRLLDERKVLAWYEVVRRLPAAYGCDAEIVVLPEPLELDGGAICYGTYHPAKNIISVALLPNPYETIATLIHEVAHAAANPRHQRHHGYSWRRQYVDIVRELLGIDVLPLATAYRRMVYKADGWWCSRAHALDTATTVLLVQERPVVQIGEDRVTIVVGRRRITAKCRSLPRPA